MRLKITKSARKFGYIIWNASSAADMETLLCGKNKIRVVCNNIDRGVKIVDRKYCRISIGWGITRNIPLTQEFYELKLNGDTLEVFTVSE